MHNRSPFSKTEVFFEMNTRPPITCPNLMERASLRAPNYTKYKRAITHLLLHAIAHHHLLSKVQHLFGRFHRRGSLCCQDQRVFTRRQFNLTRSSRSYLRRSCFCIITPSQGRLPGSHLACPTSRWSPCILPLPFSTRLQSQPHQLIIDLMLHESSFLQPFSQT